MITKARCVLVVAAVLLGCTQRPARQVLQEGGAGCSDALGPARDSTLFADSLRLVACPVHTSVPKGDPVRILVFIMNGTAQPVKVRNRLEVGQALHVEVASPSGAEIEPYWVERLTQFPPERTDVWLPRQGVLGRVVDLTCDYTGFVGRRREEGECDTGFPFDEIGVYELRVSYQVHCPFEPCAPEYPWTGRLDAGPVTVNIAAR
jgi:hypothetical protein